MRLSFPVSVFILLLPLAQSFRLGPMLRGQSQRFAKASSYNRLANKPLTPRSSSSLRSIPTVLQSLIVSPDDKWTLWAIVASSAATALKLERKTKWGNSLSGPVTAMLITAFLTNIGILPSTGSVHLREMQGFVLKLATPMLLLGADLRKIFRETGVMLKAFVLGTIGTLLGSSLGFLLLSGPLSVMGTPGDSWKIVSALTAKNIGGGLNFFAVTETLKVSSGVLGTGLAIDNILGLIYFPLISWLGAPYDENSSQEKNVNNKNKSFSYSSSFCYLLNNKSRWASDSEDDIANDSSVIEPDTDTDTDVAPDIIKKKPDEVEKMTIALSVGFIITAVAEAVNKRIGLPSVPVATLLTVATATAFPKQLKDIIPAGELLGKLLLLLFFGSVGNASGTIAATLSSSGAAALLLYGIILYAVHLTFILGVGKYLNIPMPDLLIASNANIGNAATASSLATSKGWRSRLLPGILVGTLGNALGTFAGLWLGSTVLKSIAGF